MREIKFRAWDKVVEDLVEVTGFNGRHVYVNDKSNSRARWRENCELMQYTGLKDKNGKEIYEGDIIVDIRDDDKKPQEIRWYRGGFMRQKKGYFGFRDIEQYDGDSKHFEIIGNIYENKDLLK